MRRSIRCQSNRCRSPCGRGAGPRLRGKAILAPTLVTLISGGIAAAAALPEVFPAAGALPSVAAGTLRLESYPVRSADGRVVAAELGRLAVPARQTGGKRTIELAFVRFPATAERSAPPTVYLAGGPGGSGIADAEGALLPLVERLRTLGDVVAVDTRGAGRSRPELRCRQSWRLPLELPADPERTLTEASRAARDCVEQLTSAGIDLGDYTAAASADDLDHLRRALGAPRLRLIAFSYGTRLALLYTSRHPDRVERAVLAGVEPPGSVFTPPADLDRRLAELGAELGDGAVDLPGLLRSARDRLAAAPATVEIEDRVGKRRRRVTVGAFDLQLMVVQALSSRDGIRALPAELRAIERGELAGLADFAYRQRVGWLGNALPYAIKCAEPIDPERAAAIREQRSGALLGRAVDFPFPDICDAWGLDVAGRWTARPPASAPPLLLVSGDLDGRTPAANVEAVMASWAATERLLVTGAGHGLELLTDPAAAAAVVRFLSAAAPPAEAGERQGVGKGRPPS